MNNKRTSEPFTDRDLAIATVLSERMTHFINKVLCGKYRDEDLRKAVDSLEHLLNAERKYNKRDCRFPDLTAVIMDRLGVSDEEKTLAVYVSVIYDIGVTLIDESVLEKQVLSGPELQAIRSHPFNALSLLNSFEFSEEVRHVILHHHERFDGGGYPDGLKGDEIPLMSRVLSVVDGYCALTATRLLSPADAVGEIRRGAGSIYDPAVVRALEESILRETRPAETTA
jgi:HD-GYP domain-containing protein (c-di-GMP phosphodiesterase class II)